jgi:hypothetical protein
VSSFLCEQERDELQQQVEQAGNTLRVLLGYAQMTVAIFQFSTEQVGGALILAEQVPQHL